MKKIVRIPKNNYSSGYIQFGDYEVIEDEKGNEIENEFRYYGYLSYDYSRYREEDKTKFGTNDVNVDMKIKVPYTKLLCSNHKIIHDDNVYEIKYIDINQISKNAYLYLTKLEHILDTIVSLNIITKNSEFEQPTETLLKKVFVNINKISLSIEELAEKKKFTNKYTVIMKKNTIIEELEKNDRLNDLIITLQNRRLVINHINVKSREKGLYELITEEV